MNQNAMQMFFPLVIILIFYLVVFRPQIKQQKELGQMQAKLKKNDEVVTSGGLYGVVANIKEKTVTLRVDDNVRIQVDRSAVARMIKEG